MFESIMHTFSLLISFFSFDVSSKQHVDEMKSRCVVSCTHLISFENTFKKTEVTWSNDANHGKSSWKGTERIRIPGDPIFLNRQREFYSTHPWFMRDTKRIYLVAFAKSNTPQRLHVGYEWQNIVPTRWLCELEELSGVKQTLSPGKSAQ